MVRFVMRTFNSATASRADKDPDNSASSDRQPAPVLDTLFKGRATDLFSTYIHLSQLHEQIKAGKASCDGRPVDARKLFDKEVLEKAVLGIFQNYYNGFTGVSYCNGVPFDMDTLAEGMIEGMGVDRHMEENIRVADQQALTDREFRAFLMERGVERAGIGPFQRGVADIVIHSGPHLGAFNAGISIPELIEASACMAAVCVAGKYWQERYGENQGSRSRGVKGSRERS